MTFEYTETRLNDTEIILCEENPRPIPYLKLRAQIGLMLLIGGSCLIAGLRLLNVSDPLGPMTGYALLLPVPSCCYFMWRDYRALRQGRTVRAALGSTQLPVGAR
jgi:hypothetical protein